MIRRWKYIELFVFGFMPSVLYCEMTQEDKIRSLLFKDPITEEETASLHMPDNYVCEACLGVTHCLEKVFQRIDERHTKRKLTESSIVEAVDNLCRNEELWHEYGLKEVDGKKRLTGPGLETDSVIGMHMSGKYWPFRMMEFCWKMIGDTEDVELYKIFKEGKLNKTLCYGGKRNYCKEQIKTEL